MASRKNVNGNGKKKGETKVTVEVVKQMINKKVDQIVEDKVADYNFSLSIRQSTNEINGQLLMDQENQHCVTLGSQNTLAQGVTQGTRIGNKIHIKSAKLKFILSVNPVLASAGNNPIPQPQLVRCLLYYDRLDTTNSTAIPFAPSFAQSQTTFQAGATTNSFQGNHHDFTRRFNDDTYSVLWQKDYKLGGASYVSPDISKIYDNNDYNLTIKDELDYTKYIVRNVKWNDSSVNASTRSLYFYCYTVNSENLQITSATPNRQIDYMASTQIIFEDA